jgi:hypothetical protein
MEWFKAKALSSNPSTENKQTKKNILGNMKEENAISQMRAGSQHSLGSNRIAISVPLKP